ncbi:hypothetical protein Rt10032_c05g2506 [Rhodotorula toruloides]|uniref:Uncharacterized protein n=1 Tax=Rhodotorula toruloides TaxID=5286 RepID=A0A511KDM0_RHOTO|nr:hypothetical protein Rt10032_c05g2506 [Rhodotorula toruloides]
MLSSARTAAGRATCAACSRRPPRATLSTATTRPAAFDGRSLRTGSGLYTVERQRRGAASYAQAGKEVEEQSEEEGEEADASEAGHREKEGKSEDALKALFDAIDKPADSPASESSASPSSSGSGAPPKEEKTPLERVMDPEKGQPTLKDLEAFRPRRFTIPEPTSPQSHRLVYEKIWEKTYKTIDRAFTKRQVFNFAYRHGLNLDTSDERMRTALHGVKHKWWKAKALDQMNKRELCYTIMRLHWNMQNPTTLPKPLTGKTASMTVNLTDRDLFLILSPNSTLISNLSREHNVKILFRRFPDQGRVGIILSGAHANLVSAREEVEALSETCEKTEFQLPAPATTLRPEVYQAISRSAKAFLEPGSEPDKLKASAVEAKSIVKTERHVVAAFNADSERTSTALFASVPQNLDTLRYSMFPHASLVPVSQILTGGTSSFARFKSVSLSSTSSSVAEDPAHKAHLEMLQWTERMRLERSARIGIYAPPSLDGSSKTPAELSILRALRAPFAEEEKEGKEVNVSARFGHVAWPLYRDYERQSALGPVLEGSWPFGRFADWASETVKKVKNVFLPFPPSGVLQSTKVLEPLPVPSAPSFASLLSTSLDERASSSEAERTKALLAGPRLETLVFRRWTYRPKTPAAVGEAQTRMEVIFELKDAEEVPVVRDMRILKTTVRIVKENKVDLMIPTGSHDAQFSMSTVTEVPLDEYPSAFTTAALTFHGAPPLTIHHKWGIYMLDTDHYVRRTLIPSATSSSFSSSLPTTSSYDPSSPTVPPAPLTIQERWHSLTRDGSRGVDVSYEVGNGTVEEIRKAGWWKAGLEAVENRALGRRAREGREGEGTGSKAGLLLFKR